VRVSVGGEYVVTDDPEAIDRDRLFGWLESSYWWSGGLHRSVFEAALEHSQGRALTSVALDHPALATCRRVLLATRDAHDVYARHGFAPLADPSIFMEIIRADAGAGPTRTR